VYRKPVVAIMSTGNEITDLHATALHTDGPVIFDSNRPSLQSVIESHGFEVVDLGIVPDDAHATETALRRGCRDADVVITTGGTSMGEGDMLKPVIERNLQGTIHFGRVAMKPGKPTTFATIPASSLSHNQQSGHHQRDKQIFALPGNPASALVTFHLFVLPCLRKLSGFPAIQWHLPSIKVQATSAMRLDPRPEFHRVTIQPISEPPYLIARSTGGQRSSRTVSLAYANGLVCLPSSEGADKKDIAPGDIVTAILIGKL
jgi:gephyrin